MLYYSMMVVITFVLDLRDAVLLYCGGEIPPMIITAGINTWAGSGLEIVPNYYHYRDGHYSHI